MQECFAHHRATVPFPQWVVRDASLLFKGFCPNAVVNEHIAYSDRDEFKQYLGTTVLIMGGGPSTLSLDLQQEEYDYLWTCNHFFRNPKLQNTKVDLAMLMAEVDPSDEELIQYRETFQPLLGFEVHDKWFNYEFDDYDKYFFMHSNFYGRLGIGVRMILFASAIGASTVKFCGFDGFKPIYEGNHAFQPGKTTLPSNFSEQQYLQQYDYFWQYAQHFNPNTKYINLGGGSDLHKSIR